MATLWRRGCSGADPNWPQIGRPHKEQNPKHKSPYPHSVDPSRVVCHLVCSNSNSNACSEENDSQNQIYCTACFLVWCITRGNSSAVWTSCKLTPSYWVEHKHLITVTTGKSLGARIAHYNMCLTPKVDYSLAVLSGTCNPGRSTVADEQTVAWTSYVTLSWRWSLDWCCFIADITLHNMLVLLSFNIDQCLTDFAVDHGDSPLWSGGVGWWQLISRIGWRHLARRWCLWRINRWGFWYNVPKQRRSFLPIGHLDDR